MTNDPDKPAKAKKARTYDPLLVNVTELAELLRLSFWHVSRNKEKWGFVRHPNSTEDDPLFPREDVDLYIKGGSAALKAKYANALPQRADQPARLPNFYDLPPGYVRDAMGRPVEEWRYLQHVAGSDDDPYKNDPPIRQPGEPILSAKEQLAVEKAGIAKAEAILQSLKETESKGGKD